MSTSRVDSKKRIVLPNGCPGDVFDIQQQTDGQLLLVRLEKPAVGRRMSKKACMEAMQQSPLHLSMNWEQLRGLTREL